MAPTRLFNKNFVLLFQGQLVSQLGNSIYMIGLIFWLKHATESATMVGLLSMAAMIPAVLLGPLGGTFADHFSRKKIIVFGDLINGAMLLSVSAVMIFLPQSTELIITLLFIVAVTEGIIMAVFRPAVSAAVPDLVPNKQLEAANGLIQSSVQIAMIIGQSIGGVLYRVLGAPILMLINGIGFLLSALSESFMTVPQKTLDHKKQDGEGSWSSVVSAFKKDTMEGLRYTFGHKGLRDLLFAFAIISFFLAPFGVLLPFFVEDQLGAKPDWFGYIVAGMAFGTVVGSILAGALPVLPQQKGKAVAAGIALIGGGFIAFAYSPTPLIAMFCLMAVGLFAGIINVWLFSAIQRATPSEMRGRVFGLITTLSGALAPISLGVAGVVADLLDKNVSLIMVFSGVAVLFVCPLLLASRSFHELMAIEPEEGESKESEPEVEVNASSTE